jgi:hypothetical protein
MFTGVLFSGLNDEWKRRVVRGVFGAIRWNRYVSNWSVLLSALRRLWEAGKVSEFKTPFYEPFENRQGIT